MEQLPVDTKEKGKECAALPFVKRIIKGHTIVKQKYNVAPKIAHFDFGDEPANFEDSVSVNCLVASGDLPLDIEWGFNDYPINSYSGVNTSKMGKRLSVLMIDSVNARHVGNYTCKARNLWASTAYTAQLIC
uniref:Ig-like domain-containing protein n=1 Tax=Glossina brevipalpis TaxID=37001 RepID=A0A1A9WR31_9MUSC